LKIDHRPEEAGGGSWYSVFNCIRRYGPLTKKDLQKRTGLSWGSISNHTAVLLAEKVIIEHTGQSEAAKGPNPSFYTINQHKNWIVGMDVQMNRICGAVITLDGNKICDRVLKLKNRNAPDVFKKIVDVMEFLFESVETPEEIKSIGFSMPGIINREEGKPLSVHHFTGVFPAAMLQILEEKFSVPAVIFHDPDCMLTAHLNRMSPEEYGEAKNVLLIRWSHGIGVSIRLNGEFYYGGHHAAGEMGHMIVNPLGPRCLCGNKGCLEVYASFRCVLEKLEDCVRNGRIDKAVLSRGDAGEPDSEIVWAAYRDRNEWVVSIIDECVDYMVSALVNTVKILDPWMVIIEGEFAGAPPECIRRLSAGVAAQFKGLGPFIHVRPWTDSAVIGAAEMLTNAVFSRIMGEEPVARSMAGGKKKRRKRKQ
jgi:predicted NBD/HSP70 family sugar kinase